MSAAAAASQDKTDDPMKKPSRWVFSNTGKQVQVEHDFDKKKQESNEEFKDSLLGDR